MILFAVSSTPASRAKKAMGVNICLKGTRAEIISVPRSNNMRDGPPQQLIVAVEKIAGIVKVYYYI